MTYVLTVNRRAERITATQRQLSKLLSTLSADPNVLSINVRTTD